MVAAATGAGAGDAGKSAERSSIEIKDLLRKLVPKGGSHKDRIRRLNKFRNYVTPQNVSVLLIVCLFVVIFFFM